MPELDKKLYTWLEESSGMWSSIMTSILPRTSSLDASPGTLGGGPQSPVLDNVFYVALPDVKDALAVELLHFQQLQSAEQESQKLSESKTSPTESSAEDIEQFPGSTSCLNRIFYGRHRFDAVEDKAQT